MSNLWSALIGAAAVLLVALLTEVSVSRRQRRARSVDQRRAAVEAVQDAALELRGGLNAYGPLARRASGGAGDERLADARRRVDDALARLDVVLSRVDDEAVLTATTAWRGRVWMHFLSAEEVSTHEERELWDAMNRAVRAVVVRRDEPPPAGRLP